MSNVDDAVDLIERHYADPGILAWDPEGFQDNQARESLDALVELLDSNASSNEFEEAFDRLSPTLRETLAETAERQGLNERDEYRNIVHALSTGDPSGVGNDESEEGDEVSEPKFEGSYGFEFLPPEEDSLHWVDLYVPKGASRALRSLIKDMEFTMQKGFDTLGARNPEAAPDFTNLLEGEQVTTTEGWSRARSAHADLQEQLDRRQQNYADTNTQIDGYTEDSRIEKDAIFRKLVRIKDDLNEKLQFEFPVGRRDGDEITYRQRDPDNSYTDLVVYRQYGDSGNFYLTPEAEQQFYVRHLDRAAEKWEREYVKAVEKFQRNAEAIDSHEDAGPGGGEEGDGSPGEGEGSAGVPSGPGDPWVDPAAGGRYVPQGATTAEGPGPSSSPVLDDSLAGLTDGADSNGSDAILGGELGDSTSPVDLSSSAEDELQGGSAAGARTDVSAGAVAPPMNSSGVDMLGPIMAASVISQIGNQMNRPPSDNRDSSERDTRESQRQNDRSRAVPSPPSSPPVQAPPSGGSAPVENGTLPPVTTPGSTAAQAPAITEALHRLKQNTNMDAAAAYRGTAGEDTTNAPWATVDEVARLQTGDVVEWDKNGEKRYGLIIKNQDGLFVMDQGQLVPLDPNNPALTQKYGEFTGRYLHPTGLDQTGPGTVAPPPAVVGASAQPAVPPPVSPPQV
ncbi:hypothetical protein [Nocardia sp. NPDC003963]